MDKAMQFNMVLLLMVITLIWGYAWVLMKIALDYMGPFTFAALRFAVGSLTMLLIIWGRRVTRPARADWPYLFLLGFFQTTLTFSLLMYGMLFVTAGKSSVLLYSMPLWSMALAYYTLGEKITGRKVGSLVLGILGLLFILGWDVLRMQNAGVVFGEILIVLAAATWGIANIIMKKKFQHHNKLMVSAWQMLIGTAGLVVLAFIMEWGRPVLFTPLAATAVIFCGVLASAFCFTGWFFVLSKTDTTVAAVSLLFVPITGLFFGWVQLGEEINTGTVIGSLLISLGVYLATVVPKSGRGTKMAGEVRAGR